MHCNTACVVVGKNYRLQNIQLSKIRSVDSSLLARSALATYVTKPMRQPRGATETALIAMADVVPGEAHASTRAHNLFKEPRTNDAAPPALVPAAVATA